ncbi:MAG: hypothetical protein O9267_07275 [Flavobacterium sp.]|uniref:hypothetical protein n=1 Tax=Flavobacterium sp. TaxID=239 RepID=UPI0022C50B3B|nr:hypothetical protein [Flavobacterium sp.]MCZ8197391.1 hypothetical protein [Flavobacterium sp.]
MKKLVLIGFLIFWINGFSQNSSENLKKDVEIQTEIDSNVYEIKQGNSYYTKDEKSAIQAKLISMSLNKMQENMLKNAPDVVDKGNIIINGINILFVKKISEDKANMILIYCKENDENSSISFVSFYPSESENYYKPIIEKAFLSAKIKQ